jgi:Flp pilus assembly protein TadG
MNRGGVAREDGQALVEFALTVVIFLTMLIAIFDLGRGIYMYNGLSQAAREIARVTSVHPGTTLGGSAETTAVVATQKTLVPGLSNPTFACFDIDATAVTGSCEPGHSVRVSVSATFQPITPLLSFLGNANMSSSSAIKIQ